MIFSAVKNFFKRKIFCFEKYSELKSNLTMSTEDKEITLMKKLYLSQANSNLERSSLTSEEIDNLIKSECDNFRQSGGRIPDVISDEDWQKILTLPSFGKRINFYNYLFKREKAIENRQKKKEKNRNEMLSRRELKVTNGHLQYGLYGNTMINLIKESTETRFYNWKLASAIMFGQKVVIDLDFDHLMSEKEIHSLAQQIRDSYGFNRICKEPVALYICNAKPFSPTLVALQKCIPSLLSPSCLLTISEKSYIDLFPHSNIVYLSPDAPDYLEDIDHEAIYIIGGMVDLSSSEPVSLTKATLENLKTFKLPIDKYLKWGTGSSKRLTINQVLAIIVDLKVTGSWEKALQHVPQRKIYSDGRLYRKMISVKLPQEKLGLAKEEKDYSFQSNNAQ